LSDEAQPADVAGAAAPGDGFRRATTWMAAGTVASRITGFGRIVALAYALGFTRLTDTYNLANTTPNIVYELVLGGVLSATLVPVFVDWLSTRNEDEAEEAISAVVTVAAVLLVALTTVFLVAAPWVIRLYTFRLQGADADAQQAVATALLRLFAPQVLFYGVITLVVALLNARRRFVAATTTPVLNNLVVIAALVLLPHVLEERTLRAIRHDDAALVLLGLGTTAGVAVQLFALLPFLRRARIRLRPRWRPGHEAVRTVVRLSGWTFAYVVANQVTLWVVLVLANGRAGDVSAYQAAFLFFLLPHAVFAVSIMTALLPELSERWARGDHAAFGDRLSFGLRTIVAVLGPAAAGYIVLAHPIVSLVLEHGRLSDASAATTADVLALFALGLPAFSAYLLLMRAYQAMQDTRTMFLSYCFENGLNIALGLALYPSLGVQGLALALALAYLGGTAAALVGLRRRLDSIDGRGLLTSIVRVATASAVMALGVALLTATVDAGSTAGLVARTGLGVGAGVSLYLLIARAVGVSELTALSRPRRSPG
jgi:putative peptidoglycan lipid II flippase